MPHLLLETNFALFLGRFHPLVVHLPIGMLLLAALLEFWPGERARPAINVAWGLGALSAIVAATMGWLLASDGGYGGPALFWHRWLGVGVAVMAVVGFFVTQRGGWLAKGYGLGIAGLLSLAGHQGGNLTHGEEYLFQYAPPVVQKIAGHEPDSVAVVDWTTVNPDSINLYAAFLQPVINDKCVRCHNSDKQNGGLRMDEAHYLFLGGDGGDIIQAGDAIGSEWVRRVTLPRRNVKAMPPQGEPMTYAEIRLLNYWIESGADTTAVLDHEEVPDDIKELLERDYGLDLSPKLFVERVRAEHADTATLEELRMVDWAVNPVSPLLGGALEAKPRPGGEITPADLQLLGSRVPAQIVYLSLDRLPFTDADLAPLPQFTNLNRLRLNGTKVTAATVAKLTELQHLESLNLYDTAVGDDIFPALRKMPALKRVYLWQTQVTGEGVAAFREARPNVMVDRGWEPSTPAAISK